MELEHLPPKHKIEYYIKVLIKNSKGGSKDQLDELSSANKDWF